MKNLFLMIATVVVSASTFGGTLTIQFGSAMEVEIDGTVQSFAKNATFTPTNIPCIYKMRPVLVEGERTFGIKGDEDIRGGDLLWRFPQYGDGNWVRVALNPYPSSDTTVTLTGYKTSNFYYVDAENGNDDWDGTTATIPTQEMIDMGGTIPGPKKSLQAAHDAATGTRPIIFAAPGVYNTGVSTNYSSGTSNPRIRRLISTKANIGYIATEGADRTFIVGAPGTSESDGYGAECISGVYLGEHTAGNVQFLQGFTITGCYSPGGTPQNQRGAAFCSNARRAYCLDCVISNNFAGANSTRSGSFSATNYGVIERTRIIENNSMSYVANDGVFISCIFARNRLVMSDSTASNRAQHNGAQTYFCTYDLKSTKNTSGRKRLESDSCYIYAALAYGLTEKSTTTTNATRWLCKSQAIDDPKFVNVSARDYRLASDSPAIDVLSYKDDLNGKCRMLMDFRDAYGSLRALNVNLDLGAAEYDWRPVFAQAVGKRLKLTDVSASVTTNAAGGLVISGGSGENAMPGYVAGTVSEKGVHSFTFAVSGGTLKAFVGGVSAGVYSAGEQTIALNIPDAMTEFQLAFTPDTENPGAAVLMRIASDKGFIMSFR